MKTISKNITEFVLYTSIFQVGLKAKQKVVGYSQNICATITLAYFAGKSLFDVTGDVIG